MDSFPVLINFLKITCTRVPVLTVHVHVFIIIVEPSYVNLYEAIRHGDFDSIELALRDTGMSPDARDKYNKTPLMIAAAHGRFDVAEYLITKG